MNQGLIVAVCAFISVILCFYSAASV